MAKSLSLRWSFFAYFFVFLIVLAVRESQCRYFETSDDDGSTMTVSDDENRCPPISSSAARKQLKKRSPYPGGGSERPLFGWLPEVIDITPLNGDENGGDRQISLFTGTTKDSTRYEVVTSSNGLSGQFLFGVVEEIAAEESVTTEKPDATTKPTNNKSGNTSKKPKGCKTNAQCSDGKICCPTKLLKGKNKIMGCVKPYDSDDYYSSTR